MKLKFIIAAALLFPAIASGGEYRITTLNFSKHTPYDGENERHNGLGFGAKVGANAWLDLTAFTNSDGRPSALITIGPEYATPIPGLYVGAVLGAGTNYRKGTIYGIGGTLRAGPVRVTGLPGKLLTLGLVIDL